MTRLSEALFLFAFCNTKFKKLFHRAHAIFYISITFQLKVYELIMKIYSSQKFLKILQAGSLL